MCFFFFFSFSFSRTQRRCKRSETWGDMAREEELRPSQKNRADLKDEDLVSLDGVEVVVHGEEDLGGDGTQVQSEHVFF